MKFATINPATGEKIGEYETISADESVKHAMASREAFKEWRRKDIREKAQYLEKLASTLRAKKQEFAILITKEVGKPIRQSIAEIEKCAWAAEVYARNGERWLEEEVFETDAERSKVIFQPLGVVLSIMPWNFPFWQALRFGIPTILAGNTTLLRHSRIVPECAYALEQAFIDSGFPENIFKVILTDHYAVETLIASEPISGVSFTGSVSAGSRIGELSGRHIKKVVLELGGSDAFIVMNDANVEESARSAVEARLVNSGQSCIAAKRIIVEEGIEKDFTESFVQNMERQKVGDPLQMETDVGPLVREEHVTVVEEQVRDALERGGNVLTGGERMKGRGYFFTPTAIGKSNTEMRLMKEEVFGPVAPIISVKNVEEALRIANDSEFGLAASLWTSDENKAIDLAGMLETGVIFINAIVKSDPRMPFGGIKRSGHGRELSKHGMKEFVNVKGINIYTGK